MRGVITVVSVLTDVLGTASAVAAVPSVAVTAVIHGGAPIPQ